MPAEFPFGDTGGYVIRGRIHDHNPRRRRPCGPAAENGSSKGGNRHAYNPPRSSCFSRQCEVDTCAPSPRGDRLHGHELARWRLAGRSWAEVEASARTSHHNLADMSNQRLRAPYLPLLVTVVRRCDMSGRAMATRTSLALAMRREGKAHTVPSGLGRFGRDVLRAWIEEEPCPINVIAINMGSPNAKTAPMLIRDVRPRALGGTSFPFRGCH